MVRPSPALRLDAGLFCTETTLLNPVEPAQPVQPEKAAPGIRVDPGDYSKSWRRMHRQDFGAHIFGSALNVWRPSRVLVGLGRPPACPRFPVSNPVQPEKD